jgi:hypothetical protein
MKLLKLIKPIQYITLAYAILIILFGIEDYFPLKVCIPLLVLFIVGFSFSWYNGVITGILFFLCNIGFWVAESLFIKKAGGFGMILGVPLLVLGVLYIVSEYKTRKESPPTKNQQWRIALRLLVANYTILYLIFIIKDYGKPNLFIWPGVILFGLLAIYLIGLLLSWKWELITGILFIIWYACLFIPVLQPIVYYIGPVKLFGLPILIQGILYLNYYFTFKSIQIQN